MLMACINWFYGSGFGDSYGGNGNIIDFFYFFPFIKSSFLVLTNFMAFTGPNLFL